MVRVAGAMVAACSSKRVGTPGAGAYRSANKQLMSTSAPSSTMQTGSSTSIAADVRGEERTNDGVRTRMNPAARGTPPTPTTKSSATGLIYRRQDVC